MVTAMVLMLTNEVTIIASNLAFLILSHVKRIIIEEKTLLFYSKSIVCILSYSNVNKIFKIRY